MALAKKNLMLPVVCLVLFSLVIPVCGENATNVDRNEMGLSFLYEMVNGFLGNVVQPKKIYESFIDMNTIFVDGEIDTDQLYDWKKWLEYAIGFTVCLAIGVTFVVIMPIAGFIFCCCRCCNKCGGRPEESDGKRTKYKRRTYTTFLLVFNTVVLGGVVCAFLCNSLLHKRLQNEGDKGSINNIKASLANVDRFVNNAVVDVSDTVFDTVESTVRSVNKTVRESGEKAVNNVLKELKIESYLDEAKDTGRKANETRDVLMKASDTVMELKEDSIRLDQNLSSIRDSVDIVCSKPGANCPGFDRNDYRINADFSSLDNLKEQTDRVADTLDITNEIRETEKKIEGERQKATKEVDSRISELPDKLVEINQKVKDGIRDLIERKDDALKFMKDANKDLDKFQEDSKEVTDYIYYAGIGVCCAFLLVVVLYYAGLLFGLCGERPGHGAPCCNKGWGAKFLMSGVAFTFILGWLLMLICMVMFALGGPLYTELCRYFDSHEPSKISYFDKTLNEGLNLDSRIFKDKPNNFTVSSALRKCQENKAFFEATDADKIVDLDDITSLNSLQDEVDKVKRELDINLDPVVFMSAELKTDLQNLSKALDDVDFKSYFDQINKNLTFGNLQEMSDLLKTFASRSTGDDKDTLLHNADRLDEIRLNDYPDIQRKVEQLNNSLSTLQKEKVLETSIQRLINNMESAQDDFNANRNELVRNTTIGFIQGIYEDAVDIVDGLKHKVRTKIAQCEPLSTALYTLTDSVCVITLDPLNGMWFSFGWCLFFMVPCLIFAVLLSNLYRIENPYEKHFDSLTYATGSHDTIPLTSLDPRQQGRLDPYYAGQSGLSNLGYHQEHKPYASAPPPYREHQGGWTGEDVKENNGGKHIY